MITKEGQKRKLALIIGNLPTVEEIDQFRLLTESFEVSIISSESICGFLSQTSRFQNLQCLALPDYDENTTYLPGLEKMLNDFDLVLIKERLGIYAYQAVRAKWRSRFRLIVWVDNLIPFPCDDIPQMRTIRTEVANAADLFLVQTETAKKNLMLEGIEEERIRKFKPWVEQRVKRNAKNKARALEQLGLSEGDFVIAYFGEIEWEQGLFDLAHAVKIVVENDGSLKRRLKLVFCGIGSFSAQLRDRLVTLGLDRRTVYVAPSRDAFDTVLIASDCLFASGTPSRDRLNGDPYNIMMGMSNEIPIIASRSPVVEEYLGKHRFDFCLGSPSSLAAAIMKSADVAALRHDLVKKNLATIKREFTAEKIKMEMQEIFEDVARKTLTIDTAAIDHQVLEVESKVSTKQYLAAIDLIESIFKVKDIPVHHKANLYRLIGDCFTKLGDPESGKNAYIQAIDLDQYSAKAYIGLGTVGLTKGSHDIAVLHFQKAVSLAPDDEMANLGLGLAFQGMEEFKEAGRWVLKALEFNPENTAAIFTAVKIAYEIGKFTEAETVVRKYVDLHPNDHNMIYTLGGLLFKQERYDEVKMLMDKIVKIDPLDKRAINLCKQVTQRMNEREVASS